MTTEEKLLRMTKDLWNAFIESTASTPFDKNNRDDVTDFKRCIHDLQRIIATRALYDVNGLISVHKLELLEPDKPYKPGPRPPRKKQRIENEGGAAFALTGFDEQGKPIVKDTWSKDAKAKKSKGKDEELE